MIMYKILKSRGVDEWERIDLAMGGNVDYFDL